MLHATANHTVDQHGDTATGRADVSTFIQLPARVIRERGACHFSAETEGRPIKNSPRWNGSRPS
jgi:hypothetical protein